MTTNRFLLLLLLTPAAYAAKPTPISYIPARDYPAAAEKEIDAAKTSIHLYLYLFTYRASQPNSLPARLAQALARAKARGVQVEVVLDPGEQVWQDGGDASQNADAVRFLQEKGVDVSFSSGPVLHAKALVIDDKAVLLGSTNWTGTAFNENAEANVLLRSLETARALLKEFQSLPRRPPPVSLPTLPVPEDFLSPEILGPLVHHGDERALDAYLYILRRSEDAPASGDAYFTLNDRDLARALALPGPDRAKDRAQILNVLTRLQNLYHLIEFSQQGYGTDFSVRLKEFPGKTLPLSRDYALYGWDRRLSLSGKVFHLLSLHYGAISPISPRWSINERVIAKQHGFHRRVIQQGIMELRRAALLDVEYAPLAKDTPTHIRPNIYTSRPFYDPATIEKSLQVLEKTYTPTQVSRAKNFAALLYADSDANAVEQFVKLEEQYGPAPLDKAAQILGAKDPANPKRTVGYFINTIRNIAQGK